MLRQAVETGGRSLDPFFELITRMKRLDGPGFDLFRQGFSEWRAGECRTRRVYRYMQERTKMTSLLSSFTVDALLEHAAWAKRETIRRIKARKQCLLSAENWWTSDERIGGYIIRRLDPTTKAYAVITGFSPKRRRFRVRHVATMTLRGGWPLLCFSSNLPRSIAIPQRISWRWGWITKRIRHSFHDKQCEGEDGYITVLQSIVFRRQLPSVVTSFVLSFLYEGVVKSTFVE